MADDKDQKDQAKESTKADEEKTEEVVEDKSEKKAEEAKEEPKEQPKEEPKAEKLEPTGKFKDVIKQIEELSVKDLAELVKELEERFGVSAAPASIVSQGGAAPAVVSTQAEEKAEYTIMLSDAGAQKIAVIKAVREIRPDLGLKEAKDLVDGAPREVKAQVPVEEAKQAKEKLEAAGAKVELK